MNVKRRVQLIDYTSHYLHPKIDMNNPILTAFEDASFCRFRSFDIALVPSRKPSDDGYKPCQPQILIHPWRNEGDDTGSINNPSF